MPTVSGEWQTIVCTGDKYNNTNLAMNCYEFTLKFVIARDQRDMADIENALYEAGCDDATVGVGKTGSLALMFCRCAEDARSAVIGAIKNVKQAIPTAQLIEASPDMVGLTDLAEILGCTRQNMRKTALGKSSFPVPVHESSLTLWHLSDVLVWYASQGKTPQGQEALLDLALTNRALNIAKECATFDRDTLSLFEKALG